MNLLRLRSTSVKKLNDSYNQYCKTINEILIITSKDTIKGNILPDNLSEYLSLSSLFHTKEQRNF